MQAISVLRSASRGYMYEPPVWAWKGGSVLGQVLVCAHT